VPSDIEDVAAALLAQAKAAAEAELWKAVSEIVEDTDAARLALQRVSDDLVNVWRLKLAGKDTSLEEKWLEKEARLVAARLGLAASNATNRMFIATANVLLGLGSAMLSALLKVPITLPPIGPGGVA
jgi:hypothetical protein